MNITITHAKSNILADFTGTVTVNNSSGGTATVLATDLVRPQDWNSGHAATIQLNASDFASLFVGTNGNTITTDANGITVGDDQVRFFEPFSLLNTNSTMVAFAAGTWYVEPFVLPRGIEGGRIALLMTYNSSNFSHGVVGSAASTGVATKSAIFMNRLAVYKRGTGANSSRLETVWTGKADLSATQSITYSSTATSAVFVTNAITYGFIADIDSSGGTTSTTVGTSGSASAGASTMASTVPSTLITGGAVQDWFTGSVQWRIPFDTTLAPGPYWIAHMHSISSTGSTTGGGNYLAGTAFNSAPGRMCLLDPVLTAFKRMGDTTVANSTTLAIPFKGHYATSSISAPAAIMTSDMRATTGRLYWNYMQTSG